MSTSAIKKYYDFISVVTREAGKIVVNGFYGSKNVHSKGKAGYDLVTDSDKKVEELLISKIKQQYPDHLIIGEESTTSQSVPKLTDLPTWIIDPIDGTINFIQGIPLVGISIALAIQKEIVVGIVYNPITNDFFSAIKGEGAYCNGKRIYATKNEDLHKAVIGNEISLASIPYLRARTLERINYLTEYQTLGLRSLGSAAISLCYVANGSLDVYFTDGLQCWDVAAGVFILEEAGGYASNPNGKSFDMFSRVLLSAGNKTLLNKMVEVLKKCDDKTIENVKSLGSAEVLQQINPQKN